jgi:hypothetical protein
MRNAAIRRSAAGPAHGALSLRVGTIVVEEVTMRVLSVALCAVIAGMAATGVSLTRRRRNRTFVSSFG